MKVKTLSGNVVKLNLKNNKISKDTKHKSNFQKLIAEELKKDYPFDIIYTEVFIPMEKFVLDFFIPSRKIVIECQGRQHTEHIKFFHKSIKEFHNQQDRDNRKMEWCKINNLKLVEIYYG